MLCFLHRGQRLLLLHRRRAPNAGTWNGIGGKMEPGEGPFAACIREVREETGFVITAPVLCALLVATVRATDALWVIYVFRAPAPPGEALPSDEGDLRWVDAAGLRSLRTPPDLPLLLPRILTGDDVAVVRLDYETEDGEPTRVEILPS